MEPTETKIEPRSENNKLSTPLAIIFSGILIAGAVLYNGSKAPATVADQAQLAAAEQAKLLDQVREVSSDDHVRGDPNAQVKIVEYSDTECPFCKQFHTTMKQIMAEYGDSGKVAWIYRHFPLEQLHAKAANEAEALECANELGGNDKFWQYTDRVYEITKSNDSLDPAELPRIASFVGLDVAQFNECLSSGRHSERVVKDTENAVAIGGNGTPWSVVIGKGGKKYPIGGAMPIASVKQIIEKALKGE